jgi:uncharacterized membrane protein
MGGISEIIYGKALWRDVMFSSLIKYNHDVALILFLGCLLLLCIFTEVPVLTPLQAVLGILFVFFIPGYLLHLILFPGSLLDVPERGALSFGLSIAIIPVLALVTEGVFGQLETTTILAAITSLIAVEAVLAVVRRSTLPVNQRYTPTIDFSPGVWWQSLDSINRVLMSIIAVGFCVTTFAGLLLITIPGSGQFFTEFYVLGEAGFAEAYPREVRVGEGITLPVTIINNENATITYYTEVRTEDEILSFSSPFTLDIGQSLQQSMTFALSETGDLPLQLILYRNDQPQPYRTLRLWLKVVDV